MKGLFPEKDVKGNQLEIHFESSARGASLENQAGLQEPVHPGIDGIGQEKKGH